MNKAVKNGIASCILALSVIFIIVGVVGEEPVEVMQKAVRICLECIGIG
ncbi:MAG: hypothetical protein K2P65_02690 [Lachnospiraceae bacterium]|nr:hypothetical protein [Lachnospiraceae bacterium]